MVGRDIERVELVQDVFSPTINPSRTWRESFLHHRLNSSALLETIWMMFRPAVPLQEEESCTRGCRAYHCQRIRRVTVLSYPKHCKTYSACMNLQGIGSITGRIIIDDNEGGESRQGFFSFFSLVSGGFDYAVGSSRGRPIQKLPRRLAFVTKLIRHRSRSDSVRR